MNSEPDRSRTSSRLGETRTDWNAERSEGTQTFPQAARRKIQEDTQLRGECATCGVKQMNGKRLKTPVIVITAYPDEKHRTRAFANGAVGFLSKPFDEKSLIECLTVAIKLQSSQAWRRRTAASNECPIHVADGVLGNKCHICGFFNGLDEQHRVLRSFIKEGFERGEKAFHIMDPSLREDHLKRLTDAGIDVGHAISTG